MRVWKKHPLWVRISHWLGFPVLFLMIWSGILIYWANDVYRPFFPEWFYEFFHLHHRLAEGMAIHFTLAWIFTLNGALYVSYLIFSGEWRELVPRRNSLAEAFQVVLHDLGLKKKLPPHEKFNAAQRLAYFGTIGMGALSVITGLAIYKPVQLSFLLKLLGGYEGARLIHFILVWGFIAFFVVHVVQVIRAGWNNFRSMISGLEVQDRD